MIRYVKQISGMEENGIVYEYHIMGLKTKNVFIYRLKTITEFPQRKNVVI